MLPPDFRSINQRQIAYGAAAVIGVLLAVGLALAVGSDAAARTLAPRMVAVLVLAVVFVSVVFGLSRLSQRTDEAKPKRDGPDMYTLIDDLVDDLDDDEADYLRRRLDDRDRGTRADLLAAADDLLEQRAERRSQHRE